MGISQQDPMDTVANRFPGRRSLIRSAYGASASFRELCEDLCLCDDTIARWRDSDAPVAGERLAECTEWQTELEQEIEQWLDRLQTGTD
jgi:hypothetical protein